MKKIKLFKKIDYDVPGWHGYSWAHSLNKHLGEEFEVIRYDISDNTYQIEVDGIYVWIPYAATVENISYTLTINESPVKIELPLEIHEMLKSGQCKITLSINDYTV